MPDTKNVMTTGRIDHPINIYYKEKFLRRAMPRMIHTLWGMENPMPKNAGTTIKWRRYASPTAQTVPLTEAVDPKPILQGKTDLTATVRQYGAWLKESTWLDLTGPNSHGAQRTKWLSDQFMLTIDTLCRAVLSGTASSTTCARGDDVATDFNTPDIEKVTETMLGKEAMYITKNIGASDKVGTAPILPAFVGITHTLLRNDIIALNGFRYVNQYGQAVNPYPGEIGSVTDIRMCLTTNAHTASTNYYLTIIAEEAYGNVKISNADELLIYLPPEQAGSNLKMWSSYGWKATYACKILNDNWLHALIGTRGARS